MLELGIPDTVQTLIMKDGPQPQKDLPTDDRKPLMLTPGCTVLCLVGEVPDRWNSRCTAPLGLDRKRQHVRMETYSGGSHMAKGEVVLGAKPGFLCEERYWEVVVTSGATGTGALTGMHIGVATPSVGCVCCVCSHVFTLPPDRTWLTTHSQSPPL